MQNEENRLSGNPPPDWSVETGDLLCPLCGYNLRGLIEGRCPECGFAFQWQELRDAEANRHNYIFEHGAGRNIKTFWKTYWTTCRPRKFWRDVRPTHTVNLVRLVIYWIIATGIFAATFTESQIERVVQLARSNAQNRLIMTRQIGMPFQIPFSSFYRISGRRMQNPITPAQIDTLYPSPLQLSFWTEYFSADQSAYILPSYYRYPFYSASRRRPEMWLYIFLAWPFLTLLSLFVFQASMRRAKIKKTHLIRSVIYSCDFGLLLTAFFFAFVAADVHLPAARLLFFCAMFCFVITTYRLSIAARKYLNVHLPMATALASQVIALLIVIVLLLQIADFTRGL